MTSGLQQSDRMYVMCKVVTAKGAPCEVNSSLGLCVDIEQVSAIGDVVRDAAVSHELLNPAVSTQADALAVIRYREDNRTLAK
jgi:hypothetical protein